MDYHKIIDKYYPAGTLLRDIYMKHCGAVAREALLIMERKGLPLSHDEVEAATMLHDIGVFDTNAPGIECRGQKPYIMHGIIGRNILLAEGFDESVANVAARHTGSGLTAQEIVSQQLPLPCEDFCPQTLLERLICYADKFYSKSGDMQRKSLESVRKGMAAFGEASLERFDRLHAEFE